MTSQALFYADISVKLHTKYTYYEKKKITLESPKAPRIDGRNRVAKSVPPPNKAIRIFRFIDDIKVNITRIEN